MDVAVASNALAIGTRVERYVIQGLLGAGGFGVTYIAEHELLKKRVALKEHFPTQFATRDSASGNLKPTDMPTYKWALDRFLQEARVLARCKHPNIVAVSDVLEANNTGYMVLDYEDGESLESWLRSLARRPTQSELDGLITPLLAALAFVHAQGLLHRDIASDNILVRRRDGSPCLIDFGAAREAVAQESRAMSAIVKAGYSPPEQYARVGKAQGAWSDIYALAATLYRAVSGRAPPEAAERQLDDELRPLAAVLGDGHGYRPSFLSAIEAGLRLAPSERPQTVDDFRQKLMDEEQPSALLEKFLRKGQAPTRARPRPRDEPPSLPARLHTERVTPNTSGKGVEPPPRARPLRAWAMGAVIALLAIGAGVTAGVEYTRRTTAERSRAEAAAHLAAEQAAAKRKANEQAEAHQDEQRRKAAERAQMEAEARRFREGAERAFEAMRKAELDVQRERDGKASPAPAPTASPGPPRSDPPAADASVLPALPEIEARSTNNVPHCVTPERLTAYLRARNPQLEARFETVAAAYKTVGEELGVRWDYAFYQMVLETGALSFRRGSRQGDVKPEQNNFAGLGATGRGEPGESFKDIPTGVRAHLEHLLLYASKPIDAPTAERTGKLQQWGVFKQWHADLKRPVTFSDMAQKWAPAGGASYARLLQAIADGFRPYCTSP